MRVRNSLAIAALFFVAPLLLGVRMASATVVNVQGSYTVGQSNAVGNKPTISNDIGNDHNSPYSFSLNLTVGTPDTIDFFTVSPARTSGLSGCGYSNHPDCIASDTLTATFSFTTPSGATGDFVETALYQADYDGYLGCSTTHTGGQSDCVDWSNSNDPMIVNFADGYQLSIDFINAQDWDITPQITLTLTDPGTHVPEPASLAIFGAALAGMGLVRRRRKSV